MGAAGLSFPACVPPRRARLPSLAPWGAGPAGPSCPEMRPGETAVLTRKPTPNPWVCCFQLCFEVVYVSAGCIGALSQSVAAGFLSFPGPK